MPLMIHVLRDNLGDCTNGGISSKSDRLMILNADGPFNPEAYPALSKALPWALVVPNQLGSIRIVPAGEDGQPVRDWVMMGGNFGHSSDSRFAAACNKALRDSYLKHGYADDAIGLVTFYGAVAIHDRIEG